MTDRPIGLKPHNIRAILRECEHPGTGQTQTRRMLTPQPPSTRTRLVGLYAPGLTAVFEDPAIGMDSDYCHRLHFLPGYRLWVREAWRTDTVFDTTPHSDLDDSVPVCFEADGSWRGPRTALGRLRLGKHMQREFSRITLTVTDVRVQRLQEISEADARAEGAPLSMIYERESPSYRAGFEGLWDSINAASAPWDSNPWVVAVTFTPALGNIDQVPA